VSGLVPCNVLAISTLINLSPLEWSNDGSQLLGQEMIFYDDTTRPYNMGEIVLFNPEGKVTEYLTRNDIPDLRASFSPTCDSVAIVSGVFRQRDIYILDLNTRDTTNLTNNPDHYMNVIWSPDGKEIAYTKKFFEGMFFNKQYLNSVYGTFKAKNRRTSPEDQHSQLQLLHPRQSHHQRR